MQRTQNPLPNALNTKENRYLDNQNKFKFIMTKNTSKRCQKLQNPTKKRMQNRFITYLFLSIDQINKIYEMETSANFEQREK